MLYLFIFAKISKEMYSYIKGPLVQRQPTFIVVEAGGIGYFINISLFTYTQLEGKEDVKILTHFVVKEDAHLLFGFTTEDERSLFVALISVNGVGPNTARLILSSLEPQIIRQAIISEDSLSFKKVKGVGPKTAQRIIIDLKDKISKEGLTDAGSGTKPIKNQTFAEAVHALVALGFNRIQVEPVIKNIMDSNQTELNLEELIKTALKKLA